MTAGGGRPVEGSGRAKGRVADCGASRGPVGTGGGVIISSPLGRSVLVGFVYQVGSVSFVIL